MTRYAEKTQVSAEKSKSEIETVLSRYGASAFASGWQGNLATIAFEMRGRRIRFVLPLPDRTSREFTHDKRYSWRVKSQAAAQEAYDQAVRQKWRAMLLAIKAKLEVVESGIATFEEEFMAHVVLPSGVTVGEYMNPQIASAYQTGRMPPLMLAAGEGDGE